MMNGVRHLLLAVQFFTRIPVTGRLAQWVGFSPQMLRASAAHFPAVGWMVGAVGSVAYVAALALWPPLVAAVLSTAATVLLTGAFHEDGLADVADGLGGSLQREQALEIMKDSRIGAFGAIALVLALALKLALLAALAGQGAAHAALAIVVAHVLSRLAPLALMRALPYVGGEAGKSKPLADALSMPSLCIAVLWCIPAAALVLLVWGAIEAIAVGVLAGTVTLLAMARFRRRLDGFTGDCLGATQQLSELAVYLALTARL
jgi:adenosylcobinamide-GDP ribazoletransferase